MTIGRIAASAARRISGTPWPFLGLTAVILGLALVGLVGMPVQPVTDALFDRETEAWEATERAERDFGQDPIVVVAQGEVDRILDADALDRLSVLETCLAGNVSRGRGELFRLCKRIDRLDPVAVFAGPATFLGQAVAGIGRVYREQIRRLDALPRDPARAAERQLLVQQLAEVAIEYGLVSPPSLRDRDFVDRVVFGPGASRGQPKPRLSYVFPDRESAQVIIRLRNDLTDREREEAIDLIGQVATHPDTQAEGVEYIVSGSPVVFGDLDGPVRVGTATVVAVALILMAIALWVLLGSAWRLLPLLVSVIAVTSVTGLFGLLGGELSLAVLAAAPILVGLSVDYAIQIQSRFDESGSSAGEREAGAVAYEAAMLSTPMLVTASLATAAGFASMFLSGYPLITDLGLLLGAGLPLALVLVFLATYALLGIRGVGSVPQPLLGVIRPGGRAATPVKSVLGLALMAPGRVVALALVVAGCGWVVGTTADSATSVRELLPARSDAVADFARTEEATGASGEVDLIVRSRDVASPEVVAWLGQVRTEVLERSRYLEDGNESCQRALLCPGPSIPDFIPTGEGTLNREGIGAALGELPPVELASIIPDGLSGAGPPEVTRIPFSLRSPSVEGQEEAIGIIRDVISPEGSTPPPRGVEAELAGLPVVVTDSLERLAGDRYLLALAAIAAVAIVLMGFWRSVTRVVVPLVPVVAAVGWSSLVVAGLGIPLNPLSAVLAVMVIAIAAEFGVILAVRYRQERSEGQGPEAALRSTYGRTGVAVAASGITAIAGFGALVASDVGILREFGMIAVLDLGVALVGVVTVLPAMLVLEARRPGR